MLLAPGKTASTRLLLRYQDGTTLPVTLPDNTDLTVSGSTSVGTASVDHGRLSVTAGDTFGTLGITLDPADLDLPAGLASATVQPFYLQTAELQPGVRSLTNAEIAFPAAGIETLDGMTTAGKAAAFGYTADGVGPFGWADILARSTVQRTGSSTSESTDETDPSLGYILHIALVLYGDAPAVGTKLAAVEGASVLGTVVAPAGLPTLSGTVGGRPAHLVTVELTDVTSILLNYRFDVLGSGIDDAEAQLPSSPGSEPETEPADGPTDGQQDGQSDGPQGLRGAANALKTATNAMRSVTGATRNSPIADRAPEARAAALLRDAEPETSLLKCTFGEVDAKILKLNPSLGGSFTMRLAEAKFGIESGGVTTISLVSAVDLGVSGSIGLDLGLHGEVHPTCTAADVGYDFGWLIPAPASLLFTPTTGSSIVIGLDIVLDAVAEYHAKATIQDGFAGQIGFRYNGDTDFQAVNTVARKPQNFDLKLTGQAPTTTTFPFSLDGKVGVYWQPYAGFVIGGNLVKFLEAVNRWGWFGADNQEKLQKLIDAAQVKVLKGKAGPFVHAVYQSVGSVLAKESSANVISLDATAKLELTANDLLSLLRWAGIGTLSLSITLAQIDFAVAALERHLDGSPAVTVDGVAVGKTPVGALKPVEINPEQEVKVTIPLSPAPAALVGPTPSVSDAHVYEWNGIAWARSDKIAITASGSQLTATFKVDSVDECTSTWKDITFAVISMSSGVLIDNWPGWGGKFTVKCAVPELKAFHDGAEVGSNELHTDNHSSLAVTLKGTALSKAYDYAITSDKTWLTVKPALTGTIGPSGDTATAGGDPVPAKESVDLTFEIDCGELIGEEKAEVVIDPTDSAGLLKKITVNVTADCGASLEFDPDTVTLRPPDQDPTPVTATLKSSAAVERTWQLSDIPSWLEVLRADDHTVAAQGTFEVGEQQQTLLFQAPDPPTCDADGTMKATLTAKSQVTDTHADDPHWAMTSLTVIYRCQPPKLTVTPATVTVHRSETVTVQVIGSYLAAALPVTATSSLAGLTIAPQSATIQPGSPDSAPLSIGLQCHSDTREAGTLTITASGPAPRPDPVTVPVRLLCDTELTLTPTALSGRNAVATLHWAVPENKTLRWTMRTLPEWLVADPAVGATTDTGKQESGGSGDVPIHFAVVVTAQACGAPARQLQATVTVTGYEVFPDGGGQVPLGDATADYTYTQPAGRPCFPVPDGPTAPVGGDPHMGGFNGTRYDAQVIGEYTYLTPTDSEEDGPILQARHEPTYEGSSVTSVTAVALKLDGHVLELYARPHLTIFLDGEQVTLPEATPLMIGDSASVVRVGATMTISGGGLSIVVGRWPAGSVFNFDVTTRTSWGLPVWGMLGSPTGDQDDDRRRSDGVVEDSLNWFDSDGHQAVLRFADSWRITDPAKTLLTHQGSDAFDAMNPAPISLEELAANRALIEPALPTVCAASPSRDRVISELAVELWARGDGDVAAVLSGNAQLLCRYYVSGQVTLVDGETSSSQAGLHVTVAVAGTTGCQTATAADGHYQCVLTPDPGGAAPEGGPAVQVSVLSPAGGPAIGGADTAFAAPAVMGDAQSIAVNVAVPADQLPTAILSGALITRDGTAMAGPVKLCVAERRADGSFAAARTFSIKPDPTTGAYSLTVRLSEAPARLRLTACGNGVYDWGFASKDVALDGFLTLIPLSFSVAALPAVVVSGTLLKGGQGNPGALALCLVEYQNGAPVFFQDNLAVHPDPVTGAYRLVLPLYAAPTEARVSLCGGLYEDWGVPGPWMLPVPGGTALIPLDISFNSDTLARVTLTGHIKVDGHGASPLRLEVLEDIGTGSTPLWTSSRQVAVTPDAQTGEFTVPLWLWNAPPKRLWLVPAYPAALPGWDYSLPKVFDLTNTPTQTVTVEYDVAALPILTVQGTLHQVSGAGVAGPVTLVIGEKKPDGTLYTRPVTVNPATDGSYSVSVPLYVSPPEAVKVWASSPVLPGFAQVNAAFLPLVGDGSGHLTVTANYLPDQGHTVTLTGHLTRDGVGFPGPVTLCVQEQNPSGVFQSYRNVTVTVDPVTGAFTSAPLTLLETSYRKVGIARCYVAGETSFQNAFLRFERTLDPDEAATVIPIEFDDTAQYVTLFGGDAVPSPEDVQRATLSYAFMSGPNVVYNTGHGLGIWDPINLLVPSDLEMIGKTIRVDRQYDGLWYRVQWQDFAPEGSDPGDGQWHEVDGIVPLAPGPEDQAAVMPDPWHDPDGDGPAILRLTVDRDQEFEDRCTGDASDNPANSSWCYQYENTGLWLYERNAADDFLGKYTPVGAFWNTEYETEFWLTLRPGSKWLTLRWENGLFDQNGVEAAPDQGMPEQGPVSLTIDPLSQARPEAPVGEAQIHLSGEWADWQRDLGWTGLRLGVLVPDPDDENRLQWSFGPGNAFVDLADPESWPSGDDGAITGTVDDDGYDLWISLPGDPASAWLAYWLPDWDMYTLGDQERLDDEAVELTLPEMDTVTAGGTVYQQDEHGPVYVGDVSVEIRLAPADDVNQDIPWEDMPIRAYEDTVRTDENGRFTVAFGVPHETAIYRIAIVLGIETEDSGYGIGTGWGFTTDYPSGDPQLFDFSDGNFGFGMPSAGADGSENGLTGDGSSGGPDGSPPGDGGSQQALLPPKQDDSADGEPDSTG